MKDRIQIHAARTGKRAQMLASVKSSPLVNAVIFTPTSVIGFVEGDVLVFDFSCSLSAVKKNVLAPDFFSLSPSKGRRPGLAVARWPRNKRGTLVVDHYGRSLLFGCKDVICMLDRDFAGEDWGWQGMVQVRAGHHDVEIQSVSVGRKYLAAATSWGKAVLWWVSDSICSAKQISINPYIFNT